MHELIPGLLVALNEGRRGDAIDIAEAIVDETDGGVSAVVQVGLAANLLHAQPSISLQQLGLMLQGELDGDSITGADISNELLDVIEDLAAHEGVLSPDGKAILARYDLRPGSARAIEQLALIAYSVITGVQMEGILRTPNDEGLRRSIAAARAAVTPTTPDEPPEDTLDI